MNILTFDIEEWFHLLDFDATRTEDEWHKFEPRIHQNVDRILDILDETGQQATFFIIGWIAKTYPEIVRKISERYQIGSHTMSHQLVWQQKPSEFKADLEASINLLEDITGKKVTAFRAPGFSIRESEGWAFDILAELGITTDSSVFPAHHSHGGMPSYTAATDGKIVPSTIRHGGIEIKEFPISAHNVAGKPVVFSGGGYFRLLPYPIIKKWAEDNPEYLLSYIHPRDLDGGQPMLEGLPLSRKFKSYVGLKNAEAKFRKFTSDFRFQDIATVKSTLDWSKYPVIDI